MKIKFAASIVSMMQIFSKQKKNYIFRYVIIKVYFLWTFWEWFLTRAHHSASGTRTLMAKLAIQTLTDEYLNNTPLSLNNPRGMLGEHGRSRQALASAGSSRGDIYFQLKWLGVLKMSQTTTLPKTVSRIAGLRSNVLTFFLYCRLPVVY